MEGTFCIIVGEVVASFMGVSVGVEVTVSNGVGIMVAFEGSSDSTGWTVPGTVGSVVGNMVVPIAVLFSD